MPLPAASVSSVLNALVHRAVVGPTRDDHAIFIATRLGVSFAALAIAPFFLAFRGAPDAADALVFASALAPLAGACVVGRSGRLDLGRAVAIVGLVGLSLTLWIAYGAGIGCAAAWLVAAQIEAMDDRRLRIATATVAALTLLAMMAVPLTTMRSEPADAIFAVLALAYATMAAFSRPSTRQGARIATAATLPAETTPVVAHNDWAKTASLAGGSVLELDARGTVLALHGGAEAPQGFEASNVLARAFFERVHVADRPLFLKLVADAAHGAPCGSARIRLRGYDRDASAPRPPTYRHLDMRALPGRPGDRIVAFVRDIDAVPETQDEATGTDRMSELAPNLRHELRTPLNAIIGFSEMLGSRTLRPADVDKQIDYARIIHRSGQALLALIDSTLKAPVALDPTPAPKPGEAFEVRMKKRA